MRNNRVLIVFGIFCCLLLSAMPSLADNIALSVSGGSGVGHGNSNDIGGWQFSISDTISIAALGEWNQNENPTEAHYVGIYTTGGTLLVGEMVTGTNGAIGTGDLFTYNALSSDYDLGPGTYVIAETYVGDDPGGPFLYHTNAPTTTDDITYDGVGLFVDGNATPGSNQNGGNYLGPGQLGGDEGDAFFGPNFQYDPVPEPSTLTLLGLGMFGLIGLGRRKKA